MRQETEGSDPVGDAHKNHALFCKSLTRIPGRITGAETTPVDPHHHRKMLIGGLCRTPDVQVEAVLTLAGGRISALDWTGSKISGLPHTFPGRGWLRRAPAELAQRWCGKRNAAIHGQPILGRPLHQSAVDFDRGGWLDPVTQSREHPLAISPSEFTGTGCIEMQMVRVARASRRRNDI